MLHLVGEMRLSFIRKRASRSSCVVTLCREAMGRKTGRHGQSDMMKAYLKLHLSVCKQSDLSAEREALVKCAD